MDRLCADVSATVADSAARKEDAAVTFERVQALAAVAAGSEPALVGSVPVAAPPRERTRAPRLTENWFC